MGSKLNPTQWDLICYVEQYWRENGFFPSHGEIKLETHLTGDEIDMMVFGDELVKKHLKIRGIDPDRDRPSSESRQSKNRKGRAKRLSDIQLATIALILNPADTRSVTDKLESLGVNPGTYAGWKKSKVFTEYMTQQGQSLFGEFMPDMDNALVSRATKGNLQAIKFAYEVSGRYRPQKDQSMQNVGLLLVKIVEVIQKHVRDPLIIQAIAEDVKNVQKELEA